ncbi:helix-turn-helix domain-containing protein [Hungatella hathewayi]|nr:helix-turn-helix domain-containing protein [Hungatella hathewayi]
MVIVASRLTDKQKKDIIADYVETGSYNATAKRFGVALNTVKKICTQNADIAQKCKQKKEQNTADMLAYMDSRKEQAQGIIDEYLKKLADPKKLENATISQIATAMGIVVDKFMDNTKRGDNTEGITILNDIPKEER